MRTLPTIAVVGAGVAGLSCASSLHDRGFPVEVFDKGRRPGGRVATRRTAFASFDHGAQYFTATDPGFRSWTERGCAAGAMACWQGRIATIADGRWQAAAATNKRWVGVPGMSQLSQFLASGLTIQSGVRIADVARKNGSWHLFGEDGATIATADRLVVSLPAPQAADLMHASPRLAARATEAVFEPCWAAMLGFEAALRLPFDGAFADGGTLSWICREASKPMRADREAWVVHASPAWSREHLENDRPFICKTLYRAFGEITGGAAHPTAFVAAHRWRYARVARALGESCLFDDQLGIGACGDWCLGSNIEAAFRSGQAMATAIAMPHGAASLTDDRLQEG